MRCIILRLDLFLLVTSDTNGEKYVRNMLLNDKSCLGEGDVRTGMTLFEVPLTRWRAGLRHLTYACDDRSLLSAQVVYLYWGRPGVALIRVPGPGSIRT